jgi:excisionase family DNA binding protein
MRYLALPTEPIAMADEILTVAEVAVLLKVAEKTVYTMAQNAELPCFKVRGQWRFRRLDLDAWMEAQVAGAAATGEPAPKGKAPKRNGSRR